MEHRKNSASPELASDSGAINGFAGLRVVAFESRMAAETAELIRRYEGDPIVAPAMREVPIADNRAALDFGDRLIAGEFDVVVFMTGVGTRELFRVIETRYPRERIRDTMARIVTVARGPKPIRALRDLEVALSLSIAEPNTWRELLAELSAHLDLAGKRVAVQEYGVSNHELIAGLEARGAVTTPVPVYRWALPEDRGPLRAAITAIAEGHADVALFTSSNQVINLIQTAEADGVSAGLIRGLANTMVCSIGPVCSQALRAHGIEVDLEPAHPRLGHLVKVAALGVHEILARKRAIDTRAAGVTVEPAAPAPIVARKKPHRHAGPFADHPILRACRLEPNSYTPIWLMRQAGRYMPEYRRVRERHGFIEMCRRPELSAEVTVTAVERLGVDAAIIFADILLPLLPMNVGLHFETGDGPIIDRPIRAAADLDRIAPIDAADSLGFVGEAIRLARAGLGGKTPLIGFAGAPFTLASYLIEGGASRQYQATKTMMYTAPEIWNRLMAMLARVTGDYLRMQVAAGADVIQLFDSWVGSLAPEDYRRFVLPYTRAAIAAVESTVPVIHFGTVTGNLLGLMREAGGDVIGLDWRVDLGEAWARLGYDVGVQGNLDPILLFADIPEIRRRAGEILAQAAGRPGHIFNLGHGILPETPVDHVRALIDAVHEMSRR